jgi:hypothetical protein
LLPACFFFVAWRIPLILLSNMALQAMGAWDQLWNTSTFSGPHSLITVTRVHFEMARASISLRCCPMATEG